MFSHTGSTGRALLTLASMATTLADFKVARESMEQTIDLAIQVGDRRLESAGLRSLGNFTSNLGEFEKSIECLRAAIEASREIGDKMGVSVALGLLGSVEGRVGNYEEAERIVREAIALSEAIGDFDGPMFQRNELGSLLTVVGRYDEAVAVLQEGLKLAQENHFARIAAWLEKNLSEALLELDRTAEARRYMSSAMRYAAKAIVRLLMADLLESLPACCAVKGFTSTWRGYTARREHP